MIPALAALLLILGVLLPTADQLVLAGTLGFPVGLAFALVVLYKVARFFSSPPEHRVHVDNWV